MPFLPICTSVTYFGSMGLFPLHKEIYYDFARRFFEARKGSLRQEVFYDLYNRLRGVTRSVQLLLNRLYETEKDVTNSQQVNATWLKRLL